MRAKAEACRNSGPLEDGRSINRNRQGVRYIRRKKNKREQSADSEQTESHERDEEMSHMSIQDPPRGRLLLPELQLQEGHLRNVRKEDNFDEILSTVIDLNPAETSDSSI